jgi:hypothetical protein
MCKTTMRSRPSTRSWKCISIRCASCRATPGTSSPVADEQRCRRHRRSLCQHRLVGAGLSERPLDCGAGVFHHGTATRLVTALNDYRPAFLASYPTMLSLLAEERAAGRLEIEPVSLWSGGEWSGAGHRCRHPKRLRLSVDQRIRRVRVHEHRGRLPR